MIDVAHPNAFSSKKATSRTTPTGMTILCQPSAWGGAEEHTVALARTLYARGHRVAVGLLSDTVFERFEAAAGAEFSVVRLTPGSGVKTGLEGWRMRMAGLPHDIGILAKNWFYTGSVIFDLAARNTFGSYLTIEHLTPPPPPRRTRLRDQAGPVPKLGLWWYRKMGTIHVRARLADRVFTVSGAIRNGLVEGYGFPADRVETIHNGIDVTRFTPSEEARAVTRATWGIPPRDTVFGSMGRLDINHKGLDLAVEAFRRFLLAEPGRAAWLVLVGDGPDREAIEARVTAADVGDRVIFAGRTERPELVYPAFDFLLMPSRFEGLPLSMMEAMAARCVPIGTRVSGIPEIVTDPQHGWLVDSEDVAGITTAMKEAFNLSEDRYREMGRLARQRILRHFSAERQFTLLAEAIERFG